jgi:hypothetical protein
MSNQADAKFFQILSCKLFESLGVDLIIHERLCVLRQSDPEKPIRDFHFNWPRRVGGGYRLHECCLAGMSGAGQSLLLTTWARAP